MKIILIIIDGLGDKPIPQLGNKTPLEVAKTPNLDWLAKNGICGQALPFRFPRQEKPESDTCHLALLGYDPKIYYLGRGPYEAAGIGINLKEGDLALRVNFATLDPEGVASRPYGAGKNLKVIDRRAGRIEKTQPLIDSLKGIEIGGVKFLMKKSWGHRAVLVLRGRNLSAKVSNSDPHRVGSEIKSIVAKNKSVRAIFTADILNKFLYKSHQILEKHPFNKKREEKGLLPANCILTRGTGFFIKTPSFKKRYGLSACCIAGGALYKGIGKILGMDLIKVKGATGFPNTNLKGKFLAAKRALRKYNFIFLHIKATDSLAEDGNFKGKKKFIERIDKNIKTLITEPCSSRAKGKMRTKSSSPNLKNTFIVVTADHSTCSLLKRHCSELIPILIYGNGKDSVKKFSEKTCKKGKLGIIKQLELIPRLLDLAKI